MLLLLDENTERKSFVRELRARGHDVALASERCGYGAADAEVFETARKLGRVIVTRDCDDFRVLGDGDPTHAGLLFLYSTKLDYRMLSTAIDRIADLFPTLTGQTLSLDDFAWKP